MQSISQLDRKAFFKLFNDQASTRRLSFIKGIFQTRRWSALYNYWSQFIFTKYHYKSNCFTGAGIRVCTGTTGLLLFKKYS